MKLIGISGKARAGKDLLAAHLLAEFSNARHMKFAGFLKKMCRREFNLSQDQTDGGSKAIVDTRYGMTPRQIMIDTGKFYRSINPNFWIEKLAQEILQIPQAQTALVIISDVRFPNEAEWIKRHNGILVRLERDAELRGGDIVDYSETALDDYKDFNVWVPAAHNKVADDMLVTKAMVKCLI